MDGRRGEGGERREGRGKADEDGEEGESGGMRKRGEDVDEREKEGERRTRRRRGLEQPTPWNRKDVGSGDGDRNLKH